MVESEKTWEESRCYSQAVPRGDRKGTGKASCAGDCIGS